MPKIPAFKRVFTLCVLTIFILQIFSFASPLLAIDNQLNDSSILGSNIPRLTKNSNAKSITELSSFKTTSYYGPPNQSSNSALDTMTISSDTVFASTAVTQGWEGSGIQYDPYLIININFTIGSEVTRLEIRDTTSHFVIQNCVFDSAANLTVMFNVTNGVIKENLFQGASSFGLYIDADSQYIRVIHNTFINTPSGGINVYNNNSVDNFYRYNYFDNHLPLNNPFGGIYWTDPYSLNGTGSDPVPRVHINHFNVDEMNIGSDPQLDTKAYELGWAGNGTVDNPYIITNYNLSFAMETPLLNIQTTSSYIIVTNCYFNAGFGWGPINGIFLWGVSNIQIMNVTIEKCDDGIAAYSSSNISVKGVVIKDSNTEGCYFDSCENVNILDSQINNTISDSLYFSNVNNSLFSDVIVYNSSKNGFYLRYSFNITVQYCHIENITYSGLTAFDSANILVDECLIQKNEERNSRGLNFDRCSYIRINKSQFHNISLSAISLRSISNSSIDFSDISHTTTGLALSRVDNCNFSRSNVWNCSYLGVSLTSLCYENLFSSLNVFNCSTGIQLVHANNNQISFSTVYDNNIGLRLWGQEFFIENNTVSYNNISMNNEYGIYVQWGLGNDLIGNLIKKNGFDFDNGGINITDNSENNTVVGNQFFNNHGFDAGINNSWDNGTHGNYWDDYLGVDEIAPFGIGDTPYQIDGPANSTDQYPLILGFEELKINFLSPLNQSYNIPAIPIILQNTTTIADSWYQYQYEGIWSPNQSLSWNGSFWTTGVIWNPGSYHLRAFFNDSYGFEVANDVYFVILPISLNILSPLNQSYNIPAIPIILQNTTTIADSWYQYQYEGIWSPNQSLSWNGSFWTTGVIWNPGSYHLRAFFNDSYGFEVANDNYFTILPINITLVSPLNHSILNSEVEIVISIIGTTSFIYNWDQASNHSQDKVDLNLFALPTNEGLHILEVYIIDTTGVWYKEIFSFIVDDTAPDIDSFDEISDGSEVGVGTFIPFSVIDTHFESFWYYWNNSDQRNPTIYTDIPWVEVPLATGSWTLNVFANDTAGNQEYESISLSILSSAEILQIYPNGGDFEGGFVNVSWISSENLSYNLFYSLDSGFSWILLAENIEENFYKWDTSSESLNGSTFLVRVVSTTPGKPAELRSENVFSVVNVIQVYLPEGTTEIELPDIDISITVSDDTNATIQRLTEVIINMDPNASGFVGYGLYVDITLENQDALVILTIEFDVSDYWDMIQAQGLDLYDINVYFFNESSNEWEPADSTSRDLIFKIVIGTFDHTTTIGALGKTREPTPGGNFGIFFLLIVLVVGSVGTGALLIYEHQQKMLSGKTSIYTNIRSFIVSTYNNTKKRFEKE